MAETPKDMIRAVGGAVHGDGNIFFTNQEALDKYVAGIAQPTLDCELSSDNVFDLVKEAGLDWYTGFDLNESNRYAELVRLALSLRVSLAAPKLAQAVQSAQPVQPVIADTEIAALRKELSNAKRLLVDVYAMLPGQAAVARQVIDKRTGSWFVWGIDRSSDKAAPLPEPVPDGWKLVPLEPTKAMLHEAQEAADIMPPRGKRIWEALINAAPTHKRGPT